MLLIEKVKQIKSGNLSIEDDVKNYISRIERSSQLNAFLTVSKETALKKAKELDLQIRKKKLDLDSQKLLGLSVGYKDIYSTKGIETTAASNILKGYIPSFDATAVERISKAGALCLGKLNCDAFAHGATGNNSDFGPARNPYDLTKVCGGSSSGSAGAVAADLVDFATGTDTGGSIRNPASYTNTVGLKPTYGRVSRYGVIAMASSLDSIGHITKRVEDNAYILSVTAGYDPYDSTSSKESVPNYLDGIKDKIEGIKVGVPKQFQSSKTDNEINRVYDKTMSLLSKLGAKVKEVDLPYFEYALAAYYIITPSEISSNLARFDGVRFGKTRDYFGSEAKRRIMIGTYALSSGYYDDYYKKAQQVRTLVIENMKDVFEDVDVLLGPITPSLPPKLNEFDNDPLQEYLLDMYTVPMNLAGVPSLAVPAGFSQTGLPIGMQIIGRHFDEKTIYKVGYSIERELELYKVKPDDGK